MVRQMKIMTNFPWHVRKCRACRGFWAGWKDGDEPVWFWPTPGTTLVKMGEKSFRKLALCECNPDTEQGGK